MALFAKYACQETSGTSVADSSGNARTGTANVNITNFTRAEGPGGSFTKSFDFGGGAWHVDIPAFAFENNGAATIEFWAKRDNTAQGHTVIGSADEANPEPEILFLQGASDNHLREISGGDLNSEWDMAGLSIDTTQWHFYAIRFLTDTTVDLYVDGVSKGVGAGDPRELGNTFGHIAYGEGGAGVPFNGGLCGIYLYSGEARTGGQIATDMAEGVDSGTPPTITSGSGATAAYSVAENTTAIATLTATGDPTITWSKTGGADTAKFTLGASTGVLAFAAAHDFEAPNDANTDNDYVVVVTATNDTGTDSQTITVTVTDASSDNTIALPRITGIAKPNFVLTATEGVWATAPSEVTYQWKRKAAGVSTFSNITGATTNKFTPRLGDLATTVTCVVGAVFADGTISTTADPVSILN